MRGWPGRDRAPAAGNVNLQPRGKGSIFQPRLRTSARETRIGVDLRGAAASGASLDSSMTVITDSEFHVTEGALDVVTVFAWGTGCIS